MEVEVEVEIPVMRMALREFGRKAQMIGFSNGGDLGD